MPYGPQGATREISYLQIVEISTRDIYRKEEEC